MEFWTEVRRQVLVEGLSKRAAVKKHGISWHTLEKILKHEEPPGYQQKQARPKPKIEAFLPVIVEILKADQEAPRKQRHSAKRIFKRLKKEHEFTGGYTIVKDAVRLARVAARSLLAAGSPARRSPDGLGLCESFASRSV
jgi:transposase